ncbi:hypothetical protein SESBI_01020 [Sesbania bispinosa]|nr:hypothetical protein SESBI_01020 [Sesbania bispinosa]
MGTLKVKSVYIQNNTVKKTNFLCSNPSHKEWNTITPFYQKEQKPKTNTCKTTMSYDKRRHLYNGEVGKRRGSERRRGGERRCGRLHLVASLCHWVACNVDAGGQRRENNDVCGSFRLWVGKVGTASSGGGSLCKWVCKVVFNPSGGGSLCKKLVNNFWQQNSLYFVSLWIVVAALPATGKSREEKEKVRMRKHCEKGPKMRKE